MLVWRSLKIHLSCFRMALAIKVLQVFHVSIHTHIFTTHDRHSCTSLIQVHAYYNNRVLRLHCLSTEFVWSWRWWPGERTPDKFERIIRQKAKRKVCEPRCYKNGYYASVNCILCRLYHRVTPSYTMYYLVVLINRIVDMSDQSSLIFQSWLELCCLK